MRSLILALALLVAPSATEPAPFAAPIDAGASARFTRRLASVRVEYSAGVGMTLTPGEGNLSVGPTNASNRQRIPVYDRDAHDGFIEGQDLVQDLSITLQMRNEAVTSSVANRVFDFFKKEGNFSTATSRDATITDCFRTIVTFSDGTTTTGFVYPKCEGEVAWAEGQPNTIQITIRNHVEPVSWSGAAPATSP